MLRRIAAQAETLLIGAILACSPSSEATPDSSGVKADTRTETGATLAAKTPCPADADTAVDVQPLREWRAFRAAHPYHIQTIGIGARRADGSRVLVITEPPPSVCMADIKALAPELNETRIEQWPIGHDGWVRDVAVYLPPLDSTRLESVLLDLSTALFGTTYKAEVLSLAEQPRRTVAPLDLSISAAELHRWTSVDNETFSLNGAEPGVSVKTLLGTKRYGTYFSVTPGMVLWVLPRHSDIAPFHTDARKWSLDGDVVLGGVADSESVAIIARERVVDTDVMPPLRSETIFQLAAAPNEHLAQSYERTFVFAGRASDGYDWAPIYLSPELIDTEYGSLLNITDQLLKSWSQHGEVSYVNFEYTRPRSYPFQAALSDVLGASTLTFNWNTKGAGYVNSIENESVYALNRTGALPVSYFAGEDESANDRTLAAERRAYGYFAATNDPNLARVVQYAALYQLFREFDIRATIADAPAAANARSVLKDRTVSLLERFAEIDSTAFDWIPNEERRQEIAGVRDMVRAMYAEAGGAGLAVLADRLLENRDTLARSRDSALVERVAPNGNVNREASQADQLAYIALLAQRRASSALRLVLSEEERDSAAAEYRSAVAPPSRAWIRTPSIVRSRNTRNVRSVGGHNLDAAVTHFRVDATLRPGEVRIVSENGRRIILASERDISTLSGDLRAIAGQRSAAQLERHLNELLATSRPRVIRPRYAVLPPSRAPKVRGLVPRESRLRVGHQSVARAPTIEERSAIGFLESRQRSYTGITRLPTGGYEIVVGRTGEILRAPNIPSALDVITSQPQLAGSGVGGRQFQLAGFSDMDASAFTRDIELALRRRGLSSSERVSGVVKRPGTNERTVLDVATSELDFSTAKLQSAREVEVIVEGTARKAIQVDFEIATRAAERPPLLVRIWLVFKEGVVAPTMEAIQGTIAALMTRIGTNVSPDMAAALIRTELKRTYQGIEHVKTQFDDTIIVQLTPGGLREPDGSTLTERLRPRDRSSAGV